MKALVKALVDLAPNECHFPITDARPHFYCGQPAARRSYCDHHYAVVYVPHPTLPADRMAASIHRAADHTQIREPREERAAAVDTFFKGTSR